jgi:hypothetical protein
MLNSKFSKPNRLTSAMFSAKVQLRKIPFEKLSLNETPLQRHVKGINAVLSFSSPRKELTKPSRRNVATLNKGGAVNRERWSLALHVYL